MSKALIEAAASYFGIDPARLAPTSTMTVGATMALRFTFSVEVTDEDYLGICDRMRALREPVAMDAHNTRYLQEDGTYRHADGTSAPQGAVFKDLPTIEQVMADPMAYMDRPECAYLVLRAAQLSKRVARLIGADPDPHARHFEVPEAPVQDDDGIPPHVWMDRKDMVGDQQFFAVGENLVTGQVAIPLDQLTDVQRAKVLQGLQP